MEKAVADEVRFAEQLQAEQTVHCLVRFVAGLFILSTTAMNPLWLMDITLSLGSARQGIWQSS